MSRQSTGHLPAVTGAHGTVAEILPVYHKVSGPFPAKPQAEKGGEQVEGPQVLGHEENKHRRALHKQAGGHYLLGAVVLGQHRSGQAAHDAHQGDDGENHCRRGQAQALFHGERNGVDQHQPMAGAAQTVDCRQVPESPGAPYVLVEDLGPYLLQVQVARGRRGISVRCPIGFQADVRRMVPEQGRQDNNETSAEYADAPERSLPTHFLQQKAH